MYTQLQYKTADYNHTLELEPSMILPITGKKNQVLHEFDDMSCAVVSISSQTGFQFELQFDDISDSNRDYLMDLWGNYDKADGMRRTFYWRHPIPTTDGIYKTYIVRFTSQLRVTYHPHLRQSVGSFTLRVEGVKA
jgi:hypothetical protein